MFTGGAVVVVVTEVVIAVGEGRIGARTLMLLPLLPAATVEGVTENEFDRGACRGCWYCVGKGKTDDGIGGTRGGAFWVCGRFWVFKTVFWVVFRVFIVL